MFAPGSSTRRALDARDARDLTMAVDPCRLPVGNLGRGGVVVLRREPRVGDAGKGGERQPPRFVLGSARRNRYAPQEEVLMRSILAVAAVLSLAACQAPPQV